MIQYTKEQIRSEPERFTYEDLYALAYKQSVKADAKANDKKGRSESMRKLHQPATANPQLRAIILAELASGPKLAREIVAKHELDWRALSNTLGAMRKKGEIVAKQRTKCKSSTWSINPANEAASQPGASGIKKGGPSENVLTGPSCQKPGAVSPASGTGGQP